MLKAALSRLTSVPNTPVVLLSQNGWFTYYCKTSQTVAKCTELLCRWEQDETSLGAALALRDCSGATVALQDCTGAAGIPRGCCGNGVAGTRQGYGGSMGLLWLQRIAVGLQGLWGDAGTCGMFHGALWCCHSEKEMEVYSPARNKDTWCHLNPLSDQFHRWNPVSMERHHSFILYINRQ